jgi:PAS domain S-box-containing protein
MVAHEPSRRSCEFQDHLGWADAEGLLETARAAVLVLDAAGRAVRCNPCLEETTGRSFAEMAGRDWFLFVPERERAGAREAFARALQGDPVGGRVTVLTARDRDELTVKWWARAVRDQHGAAVGVISLLYDITETERANARALQAERLAAMGEMMRGLTHESRNALQRSQACLEMLALKLKDRPDAVGLIDRIFRAQRHLHHLHEEVYRYAAPITLQPQPWDLGAVVRQTWDALAPLRAARPARLRQETGGLDLRAAVDRPALEQVVRNLLENSLDACADPVEIEVHWSATALDGRPALQAAFRDNGPGLTAEGRQKLFEPFYTTKTQGTGLGLAMAKRLLEAHGGRITVGESDHHGAEILIALPRGSL